GTLCLPPLRLIIDQDSVARDERPPKRMPPAASSVSVCVPEEQPEGTGRGPSGSRELACSLWCPWHARPALHELLRNPSRSCRRTSETSAPACPPTESRRWIPSPRRRASRLRRRSHPWRRVVRARAGTPAPQPERGGMIGALDRRVLPTGGGPRCCGVRGRCCWRTMSVLRSCAL